MATSRIPLINPENEVASVGSRETSQEPANPPLQLAISSSVSTTDAILDMTEKRPESPQGSLLVTISSVAPEVEPCIPAAESHASSFGHSIGDFKKLDFRSVKLERISWRISVGIVSIVLLGVWLLIGLVFRGTFDRFQWIGLACFLGVIAGLLWLSKIIPERSYSATSWKLMPHGLEIRRGIWWRHRIFIPASRIQHTDVQQGPFERRFELATLVVNTGGTHEPSISLSGITLEKAEHLRDQLSQKNVKPRSDESTTTKAIR